MPKVQIPESHEVVRGRRKRTRYLVDESDLDAFESEYESRTPKVYSASASLGIATLLNAFSLWDPAATLTHWPFLVNMAVGAASLTLAVFVKISNGGENRFESVMKSVRSQEPLAETGTEDDDLVTIRFVDDEVEDAGEGGTDAR